MNLKDYSTQTNMRMIYVAITPKLAELLLEGNDINRTLSQGTFDAYARDIENGNWDEETGESISINSNGKLENGQHRLEAIKKSGKTVKMWVCTGVKPGGLYDSNRKRNIRDQIAITRPDLETVYHSHQFQSVARFILQHRVGNIGRKTITSSEMIDFIDEHKEVFDGFFLSFPQSTPAKTGCSITRAALFMAYCDGVPLEVLIRFYEILTTGMYEPSDKGFQPIIRYRNYLLIDVKGTLSLTLSEVKRCQWAISRFVAKSKAFQTKEPAELIYPFPFEEA